MSDDAVIKVLFMGRKPVAAQCLVWLLSNKKFKVVGVLTDNHLSISPTTEVAKKNSLKLFSYEEALQSINEGSLIFDLGISMLYWRILKQSFINAPKQGVVNFHPAPLPEYKGTAGYNMAILEGLHSWAVTAHYIDNGVDTGPIIDSLELTVCDKTETAQSLERRCQPLLFQLFKKTMQRVMSSDDKLPTKPNVGGRYISRNDMEAMKEVGPNDDVSRKIRAFWFPPYDGAYQIINGVKCTLIDRFILNSLGDDTNSSLFTPPLEQEQK